VLSSTGERLDSHSVEWIHKYIPHVIVNDIYVLTETGMPIAGNFLNVTDTQTIFPTYPGSVTRPLPGYEVSILNDSDSQVGVGQLGKIAIKTPLPPGFMYALGEKSSKEYYQKYFSNSGYFMTGDSGSMDSNGYLSILGRTEELIHIRTGEIVAPLEMEQ